MMTGLPLFIVVSSMLLHMFLNDPRGVITEEDSRDVKRVLGDIGLMTENKNISIYVLPGSGCEGCILNAISQANEDFRRHRKVVAVLSLNSKAIPSFVSRINDKLPRVVDLDQRIYRLPIMNPGKPMLIAIKLGRVVNVSQIQ